MVEIWRDIEGYEGLYQVSNFGRVKSLNKRKGRILKPIKDHFGYLRVNLYKDFKYKIHKVHRLVAQAFIENPNNYPIINHKDEDKTNNKVENLEWCNHQYNNNYGTVIERKRKTSTNNPKTSKKVLCVETGIVYPSLMQLCRELNLNSGSVCNVCNGKHKTHKGLHFKYV